MKTKHALPLAVLAALCCFLGAPSVHGQAYCAIRSPNKIIHELFSGEVTFTSEIMAITAGMNKRLPETSKFRFDAREIAKHVVYKVYRDTKLLGYLQVRTEPTKWGLTELAWATDPQNRIIGVKVQRSREPHAEALADAVLANALKGLSSGQIMEKWTPEFTDGLCRAASLPVAESADLVNSILASALKALWLCDDGWGLTGAIQP
jgi:hypothetical protein